MKKASARGRQIDSLDVVLIEDNRGAQAILRSMLSSLRVRRLRVFDRAEDALKQMMLDPPDAVVTGWDMKPMSGQRFLRVLRNKSMAPLCFVPIIVMSARPTVSMVDRAFSSGANCILVKPIAPITMLRRLEWASLEDSRFALKGDHYMLEGIEETLETRLRRNELGDMLRRRQAIHEALTAQGDEALADQIVNGEIDLDTLQRPLRKARPRGPSETWNSWAVG